MYVYAALGDSITFGQNASSVDKAYPNRIISILRSRGTAAKRIVLARPGWTSADLARAAAGDPYPLRAAHAVSVWIGGDDLIRSGLQLLQGSSGSIEGAIRQYERKLDFLLHFIRTAGPSNVICCTQYNPFPNSPLAGKGIGALNQAILTVAARNGCRVARVDQWFAGKESGLIYGYRSGSIEEAYRGNAAVHPNDEGHEVIARGLFPYVAPGNK